jgi:acyl dehydratase
MMEKNLSRAITLDQIPNLIGTSHDGAPMTITREQRDHFELLTFVDKAHPEPDPPQFPADIVEGFHTLALLDAMSELARPFDPSTTFAYNYGLDRVRWISPVRIGDQIRSLFECVSVDTRGSGWLVRWKCTATVLGSQKPAMIAEWLVYVLPRDTEIAT